jgi:hypothetical protein
MMKNSIVSAILLPLALGLVVPKQPKVDYSGYLGLRVTVPDGDAGFEEQIEDLATHILNPGQLTHLDIVVPADKVEAVKSLAPTAEVIVEDVGATIAEEGELVSASAGEFIRLVL